VSPFFFLLTLRLAESSIFGSGSGRHCDSRSVKLGTGSLTASGEAEAWSGE
jgi:hypothetical protein